MDPSSETPLSDLVEAYAADNSPKLFSLFVDRFRRSELGVVALGAIGAPGMHVSSAEAPVSVGLTTHGGGKPMVLAFADPAAFAKRFGAKFNAGINGDALLATALLNPDCAGVLVNSAITESAVVIPRAYADRLKRSELSQARRRWWRFW
jgi:hypothetical protein